MIKSYKELSKQDREKFGLMTSTEKIIWIASQGLKKDEIIDFYPRLTCGFINQVLNKAVNRSGYLVKKYDDTYTLTKKGKKYLSRKTKKTIIF